MKLRLVDIDSAYADEPESNYTRDDDWFEDDWYNDDNDHHFQLLWDD